MKITIGLRPSCLMGVETSLMVTRKWFMLHGKSSAPCESPLTLFILRYKKCVRWTYSQTPAFYVGPHDAWVFRCSDYGIQGWCAQLSNIADWTKQRPHGNASCASIPYIISLLHTSVLSDMFTAALTGLRNSQLCADIAHSLLVAHQCIFWRFHSRSYGFKQLAAVRWHCT